MESLVAPAVVLGAFAAVLGGFAWLALVIRRKGLTTAMSPIDEIYQPSALRSRIEIQIQDEAGGGSSAAGSDT
jgi:hypothetical protein